MGWFGGQNVSAQALVQVIATESQENTAAIMKVLDALARADTAAVAAKAALDAVRNSFRLGVRLVLARQPCREGVAVRRGVR